uniref:HDC17524 n=1 Tax=Drosophila melanogaster TaxID=7227 RepID=Q6IIN2_DROME|nr:TPA_inf: HDC17524 [Drosophila melanogaster]
MIGLPLMKMMMTTATTTTATTATTTTTAAAAATTTTSSAVIDRHLQLRLRLLGQSAIERLDNRDGSDNDDDNRDNSDKVPVDWQQLMRPLEGLDFPVSRHLEVKSNQPAANFVFTGLTLNDCGRRSCEFRTRPADTYLVVGSSRPEALNLRNHHQTFPAISLTTTLE